MSMAITAQSQVIIFNEPDTSQPVPQVYNPKNKPWIQPENAGTEELIAQVSKCPSGALSIEK